MYMGFRSVPLESDNVSDSTLGQVAVAEHSKGSLSNGTLGLLSTLDFLECCFSELSCTGFHPDIRRSTFRHKVSATVFGSGASFSGGSTPRIGRTAPSRVFFLHFASCASAHGGGLPFDLRFSFCVPPGCQQPPLRALQSDPGHRKGARRHVTGGTASRRTPTWRVPQGHSSWMESW